nr:hypothetical protein [Tanacetum cinerariifolium]
MQTQTPNTLHNAIMEAGSKDRPPMLAPVQIILTGIDNDICSTVDACSNACEMWKAIERLKHGESINLQDLETNLYCEFGKFTSQDGESLESYYSRFYKMMSELIRNQCKSQELKTVSYHKLYDILKQRQHEVNEIKAERIARVANPLALVAQQQQPEEARIQLNAEQADWRDDTDDDELEDQELEAHYMYMAQLQEVSPDAADSGPIFDAEPLQKVSNDDHYNVFIIESAHPEQSESVLDTYPIEKDAHNMIIDSLDMSYDRVEIDQNDDDNDLAKERELLAYLIEKLKCEIDESKNRNKFLETSNKVLVEKLKELARRNSVEYASQMEIKCAKLVEILLFIVDSRCSKHMTKNLKLLINFVKFLETVKFGNDQIAHILGYGDLVQGASTCYIRDLKGNDLLTGSRGTGLYSTTLQDTNFPNPICLMAKATSSQAWLWHRYLSHLNFDTINLLSKNDIMVGLPKLKFVKDHLCSSCELGKAKQNSFHTKITPSSKRRLQLLHIDLCGPMRVASINGKQYVLVIVDDYSRYTWTHFLRSKDETPKVLIDFLRLVQRGLQAQVRIVRTDKGTEILNQTLHAYFAAEGILHQTSVARTPEQNGVVKIRNRTLVEAARTMLSAAKVPLFFWAKAITTSCFTQNHSLVIPRHEKTPYHIINDRKPSVKFFHIFGSLCYIVRDGENLDKMKEKGDECSFMASDHISSEPTPECQGMALEHDSLSPDIQYQENVTQADRTVTTSNELDLLYSLMFDELLNGSSKVVSKSSAVSTVDAPNQRLQHTTLLNTHTTPAPTCQVPPQALTVTSIENITQAESNSENAQVSNDEFINIFCTPIQDRGETSSRHVDSSNMHTFYQ